MMSSPLPRRMLVLVATMSTGLTTGASRAQDPLQGLPGFDDPPAGVASGGGLEGMGDPEGLDGLDGAGTALRTADGLRVSALRGFLASRGRFFPKDRRRGDGRLDGQWIQELQLEFDLEIADGLTGFFRPRFLIDAVDSDLVRTEPLEAYVTWSLGDHELRAGQLVENWGIADTFNPIDVINRRDIAEDPLDPVRLGELGVRWRWFLPEWLGGDAIGEPTLSFYALPVFRQQLFPAERSRWSLAAPPAQLLEDQSVRPEDENRLFFAVRANSTLNTAPANADVQLLFSRGPERFPQFAFSSPGGVPGGAVGLLPIYYGLTTVGGGLRAVPNFEALADYTIKAEVVYKMPFRFDGNPQTLADDYLQYAFGVDRMFPNVLTDKDQITLTVEWVGETGAEDITALYRPFDDDLVVRALWEANDFERTSIEFRGFVDPNKNEWLLEGVYQQQLRMIHEDLQFEIGARWFDVARSEPGFFQIFPDNSSVWVELRYDF
ncbi:MAG: hypothetical protein AB8H80_05755 [Planctomycetota bacterium]